MPGVDAARALALVGMMAVHIFAPVRTDGSLHPSYVVAAGRSAALFAVLAGVGLALATGRQQPYVGGRRRAARAGVLARAGLLVSLGLLLGQVDSPPLVILAYYGVLFVLAVPFLGLPARALAALAGAAALVTPVLSHLARLAVSPTPVAEPGGPDLLKELFLTGTYPALTWTTYLLVGLAVGRCDLRHRATGWQLLSGGVVLALGAKLASTALVAATGGVAPLRASLPADSFLAADLGRWLREGLFGTTPTADWRWLLVSSPHSGTTFDLLHTSGTAMAVLGGALVVARHAPRRLLLPLAAAGSMTLTLYLLHVLALADGSPLRTDDSTRLWAGHVLVALVLATVWRSLVGRGPLESLAAGLDRTSRRLAGGAGRLPVDGDRRAGTAAR